MQIMQVMQVMQVGHVGPYLIFVHFGTPPFFVKVHQRVRKFATKEPILAKILRSLF